MPDSLSERKIVSCIHHIRGCSVMLDSDLAALYEVETRVLNQAVKRNICRFPSDFMFQLTADEMKLLISQSVTSRWGGTRKLPYAFTENGVAMLSSVLSSEKAITVNIQIMRMFTRIREMLLSHADLKRKIEQMEKRYDQQFKEVFDAIKWLLKAEETPRRKIGFRHTEDKK